jgi:hypothetical protein
MGRRGIGAVFAPGRRHDGLDLAPLHALGPGLVRHLAGADDDLVDRQHAADQRQSNDRGSDQGLDQRLARLHPPAAQTEWRRVRPSD